jgi:hypothetical protein
MLPLGIKKLAAGSSSGLETNVAGLYADDTCGWTGAVSADGCLFKPVIRPDTVDARTKPVDDAVLAEAKIGCAGAAASTEPMVLALLGRRATLPMPID